MKCKNEGEQRLAEPLEVRLHRLAREFSELERLRRDVRKAEEMLKRRGRVSGRAVQKGGTFGLDEPSDAFGSIINKN